jgi:hypothetical protein
MFAEGIQHYQESKIFFSNNIRSFWAQLKFVNTWLNMKLNF